MVGGSQTDRPSTSTAAEILLEEASDEITKGGAYGICIGTLLKKGGPLDKENKKTRKNMNIFLSQIKSTVGVRPPLGTCTSRASRSLFHLRF